MARETEGRPVLDMKAVVDPQFASGNGVLLIDPSLDDHTIAVFVREALKAADGKAFMVIESGRVVIDPKGDQDLIARFRVASADISDIKRAPNSQAEAIMRNVNDTIRFRVSGANQQEE